MTDEMLVWVLRGVLFCWRHDLVFKGSQVHNLVGAPRFLNTFSLIKSFYSHHSYKIFIKKIPLHIQREKSDIQPAP